MNPLYVGIDVSSKSNVVYLMLPDGSKHSNFTVTNSQDGSTQLVKRILSAVTSFSLDTVIIGLEATSVYGDNLVYYLREDATLVPYDRKIHVLNPKQVKNFKEAYNDLPKNDYVDSYVIADCLRFGRINKEVYQGDYRYKPVDFSYSKSKELLACLVDRHGAICSNDTMIGCLWPEESANKQTKARIRKYVKDLRDTFASIGITDIIRHKDRVGIGLDIARIDCDYYRYLEGDPGAIRAFNGRYMVQYAFADETRAELNRYKYEEVT